MSMLNFKYGLHDNLPEYSNLTQGTIFVTADEQAMYIDLPQIQKDGKTVGGRIRVSQIITLDNIADWQQLSPPYNTESFYYIINANALLKCNEIDGQYQWTQINSTATLDEAFENLAAIIGQDENSGLRKSVSDNAAAIATINTTLKSLAEKDNAFDTAIASLIARTGAVEDDLADLGKVIGYIGEFADASEITSPKKDDVALIGGNIKRFDGTNWQDYGDLVDEIEKLRALYTELKNSTPTSSTFEELTTRVDNLETWKNGTVTPTLENHEGRIGVAEGKIDDILKTIGNEESGLIADIAAAAALGQQGIDDAAVAQTNATKALADALKANTAIGDANSGLVKDIADNKQAAANADKKAQDITDVVNDKGTGLAAAHAAAKAADDKAAKATTAAAEADAKGQSALNSINHETTGLAAAHAAAKAADDKAVAADTKAGNAATAAQNAQSAAAAAQKTADGAAADASKALTDAASAQSTANKGVADAATAQSAADAAQGTANEAKNKAETAQTEIDALEDVVAAARTDIATNATSIATLKTDLSNEVTNRTTAINDLRDELLSDIQTADAMKFIATIASASALPVAGGDVAIGYTYKAIAEFGDSEGVIIVYSDVDDQVVHIGDLLIAQGTEVDGKITSDLQWLQIPSGYVADYNPELEVEEAVNGVVINLTSGAYKDGNNLTQSVPAGDLGQITLRGDTDSAVKITASANEVTISMAWGTFGEV